MIEAVGWRDFDTYFRRCSELLADDGVMLLQAITIDDRAYDVEKATKSFINAADLPRRLPAVARRDHRALPRRGRPTCARWGWRTSPATTSRRCAHWRERFDAQEAELERRGYDERFRRLWRLYLGYCEAGFAERRIGDVQLLLAKPAFRDEPVAPLLPQISAARAQAA